MKYRFVAAGLIVFLACACVSKQKPESTEGYIPVTGGKIWYRIDSEGDKTPLVLLHGGPGGTSYYLNPLTILSKDRPVVFFDQLGCGRSDRITSDSLMTVSSFVNQLEEIRNALGLKKFYLYGQSWGTILAAEYCLKYPGRVKALILSSPILSTAKWIADADTLISTLPDSIQQAIRENDAKGTYDSPAYLNAINAYYQQFVARNLPWSYDIDSSFAGMGVNVYLKMWGPSEFRSTGTLKNYDITARMNEIRVPTLFICGEFDEARPTTVRYYQSLVPGAKFSMIRDAAHMTMQDNPNEDIRVISEFLRDLE